MKKLLLAIFAAVVLIGCASIPNQTSYSPRSEVHKLANGGGSGSGVVIAPGYVLTAAHVAVEPGLMIAGHGKDTGVVAAAGQGTLDLALLAYPKATASCPCAKLADNDAVVDEPVIVVGYPYGIAQVVTRGESQGVRNIKVPDETGLSYTAEHRLVITAPAAPGNSGGGVFAYRDGKWQLVGILTEAASQGNLSLAIPVSDIKKFLKPGLVS